jgi:ATP-dependent Clp protease ATP-binding subunit ClpA
MQVDLRRLPADQQELRGSLVNGYNFTERVRKVLAMAREEAVRLHHEYVGTEHILLGLIREGGGVGTAVIQNLGTDLDGLWAAIEAVVKKGNPSQRAGPDLPYTSRAKKVLEFAMAEARELNHGYVGTEHLLLGLIREERGIAAQVLVDAGITIENAREGVIRVLGEASTEPESRNPERFKRTRIRVPREEGQTVPRFVERLRTVIAESHKVAAERNVTEVTPAHLAIALLQHGEGMANAALDQLGLDRAAAILALNDLTPLGTDVITPETVMNLDPAGIAALQATIAVQEEARSEPAGTQHLLIGLLTASPEVAAVFSAQDIDVGDVRNEIERMSG